MDDYRCNCTEVYTELHTMLRVHFLLFSVLSKITEVSSFSLCCCILACSLVYLCPSTSSESADLSSEVSIGTEIEGLSNLLPQLWVSPCPTLTLSLIKTGDTSGAVSTDSHLQTLQHKESVGTVVRCVGEL